MGVISQDTFKALDRYVAVRLQQGVPIVDADWNAMEDTRRYELRAYLKWFVGDGVPDGNDGFRIIGSNADNDVLISQGYTGATDPLRRIGRAIVDGLDVMIETDVAFRAQKLHTSQAGADAESARLGVPKVKEIDSVNGPVAIYLDVWERLVTPSEDSKLVHTGLGTESCARIKREWVVRARAGTTVPTPADVAEYISGHSYSLLALVARRTSTPKIAADDVTDVRERSLMTPPSFLISDVFGRTAADYRRGIGRPVVSHRDAINALLRGELPSSPETPLAAAPGTDVHRRGIFVDDRGHLVAIWQSNRVGTVRQVFGARLDLAKFGDGFGTPLQITADPAPGAGEPHAAPLPNGEVICVYTKNGDVFMRRGAFANLAAAGAEQTVVATAAVDEGAPFVAVSGDTAVVIWHNLSTSRWMYRRYRHTTDTWLDPAAGLQLSSTTVADRDLHAAVDATGRVWVAFTVGLDIRALSFDPGTGSVANETTLSAGDDSSPFVLPLAGGTTRVLWASSGAAIATTVQAAEFRSGAWGAPFNVSALIAGQPTGAEVLGRRWTVASSTGSPRDVFAIPESGGIGAPVSRNPSDDFSPFPVVDPATGALFVFWISDRNGNQDLFYKRIITAV